jgi:indolepyruvate ferredoxin oxidoreductase beta subunit
MMYDIYLVGVGGQGILTIGSLIAEAAEKKGLAINFFPSKGMAQRGGFVNAQLRIGRETVGPNIPEKNADLAISMELSESLKAVRYCKPGGDYILFADIWAPTEVSLGKAAYPKLEEVQQKISASGIHLHTMMPNQLPVYHDLPVQANLFLVGYAIAHTALGTLLSADELEVFIEKKWTTEAEANLCAYHAGLKAKAIRA